MMYYHCISINNRKQQVVSRVKLNHNIPVSEWCSTECCKTKTKTKTKVIAFPHTAENCSTAVHVCTHQITMTANLFQ